MTSLRDNIIDSFVLQYYHLKSFQKFCETEQLNNICSISSLLKLQKEQMSESTTPNFFQKIMCTSDTVKYLELKIS